MEKSKLPFRVRGLPILDLLAAEGSCRDYEGDMTPTAARDATPEERREHDERYAAALRLCAGCTVKFACAVYSLANQAHPIHGVSVLSGADKVRARTIAFNQQKFNAFVINIARRQEGAIPHSSGSS